MKKKKYKIKKKFKILLFVLIIIIIAIITYFINKKKEIIVTLIDNLQFEVNSRILIKDLIVNIENGTLDDETKYLDTSKIGKNKVTITLKNKEEYSFYVNIIDNEKPNIDSKEVITITKGDEIDLLEYVTATDNYDDKLEITVQGNYDNNKVGSYNLKYVTKDSSGNESIKDFTLNVEEAKYRKMPDKTIKTSKGYTLKIKKGVAYIDDILIVNKTYYLPENYTPVNSYQQLTSNCAHCLEEYVMTAFNEMNADAKSLGLNLWIASGYRSYSIQSYLYNNYVNRDGKIAADTYSARSGHSEHQTGLAFDLNSVSSSFANTNEGKWIQDNCHLYGFIIRYPKGKEQITGYMYEPWHLRYVGKELAKNLYNNGDWISLEEYFGIDSKYED